MFYNLLKFTFSMHLISISIFTVIFHKKNGPIGLVIIDA